MAVLIKDTVDYSSPKSNKGDDVIYMTYSKRQDAFNRERSLVDMIASNLRQLKDGGSPDWIVVGYAESEDEYRDLCSWLPQIVAPRKSSEIPS